MKERIMDFLRAENKSSSQFADEIGVQPSGISHIISGRNKPSLDFIMKMLEKYPYLSTEWLLFGRGDMYISQQMQDLFSESVGDSKETLAESAKLPKNEVTVTKNPVVQRSEVPKEMTAERIVMFYNDGSFIEYKPGRE
jgi:transcriptional regulator with XRE-family HTH domain